ncbi:MAG: hypothetical protein JNL21_09190 [Myxococcales bacterium]|nr:hypothetical protein [Myxococcales bacterium]
MAHRPDAILRDGLFCWGNNDHGQLGRPAGSPGSLARPPLARARASGCGRVGCVVATSARPWGLAVLQRCSVTVIEFAAPRAPLGESPFRGKQAPPSAPAARASMARVGQGNRPSL